MIFCFISLPNTIFFTAFSTNYSHSCQFTSIFEDFQIPHNRLKIKPMKENQPDKEHTKSKLQEGETEQEGGLSMAPPKFSLSAGAGPIQKKDAGGVVQRQANPTSFPWYGVVQGAAPASLLSSAQIDPNNANAIAQIPLNTRILATGRSGDFLNVEYGGQRGFVHVGNVNELGTGNITHQNASPAQAQQLFTEMAGLQFLTTQGQLAPVPYHYPPDGCYARAHLMMQRLTELGYASEKVFAISRTQGGGAGLHVPTPYGPDTTGQPAVDWWYHVAPIIRVQQADGSTQQMVLDPSMTSGPVTISQWTGMMSGQAFQNLSISQVQNLLQQNNGNFPTGQNITYTVPRDNLFPGQFRDGTHMADANADMESVRGRLSDYALYARGHEVAAAVRGVLSGGNVTASALETTLQRFDPMSRFALAALFPNLITQIGQALNDPAATRRIMQLLGPPPSPNPGP